MSRPSAPARTVVALAALVGCLTTTTAHGQAAGPITPAGGGAGAAPAPVVVATPAPAAVVREIQAVLAQARARFEARDAPGVLAHVSDQYRSGPLTKEEIRQQLLGVFGFYDAIRASVRVDEIQMVEGYAWIYTTGEVSGRVPLLGSWITFLAWEREPEVARREGGAWRLYGAH